MLGAWVLLAAEPAFANPGDVVSSVPDPAAAGSGVATQAVPTAPAAPSVPQAPTQPPVPQAPAAPATPPVTPSVPQTPPATPVIQAPSTPALPTPAPGDVARAAGSVAASVVGAAQAAASRVVEDTEAVATKSAGSVPPTLPVVGAAHAPASRVVKNVEAVITSAADSLGPRPPTASTDRGAAPMPATGASGDTTRSKITTSRGALGEGSLPAVAAPSSDASAPPAEPLPPASSLPAGASLTAERPVLEKELARPLETLGTWATFSSPEQAATMLSLTETDQASTPGIGTKTSQASDGGGGLLPEFPSLPGIGTGSASGVTFGPEISAAALLAVFLLVVPRLGRWPRPLPDLARPPILTPSLEPG
jgi:hypothetical protein